MDSKIEFHNALNRIPSVHVREGVTKYRRGRGSQQKGVDVMLAVEALQQAIRGNTDEIVLVISDLDFYPLLEALAQTRVSTELFYNSEKTAPELIYSADFATPITYSDVLDWVDISSDIDIRLWKPHAPLYAEIS